jgi:hypothetical protein
MTAGASDMTAGASDMRTVGAGVMTGETDTEIMRVASGVSDPKAHTWDQAHSN